MPIKATKGFAMTALEIAANGTRIVAAITSPKKNLSFPEKHSEETYRWNKEFGKRPYLCTPPCDIHSQAFASFGFKLFDLLLVLRRVQIPQKLELQLVLSHLSLSHVWKSFPSSCVAFLRRTFRRFLVLCVEKKESFCRGFNGVAGPSFP